MRDPRVPQTGEHRVLVTNAQLRSGLAAIRSLGEKGISVTAADSDRICSGFFSRYAVRKLLHPDPQANADGFVEAVLRELNSQPYDLIMPINDHTMVPLSKHKKEIEQLTRYPYLPYEQLVVAHDKALTVQAALECGVRVPRTSVVSSEDDIRKAMVEHDFPVILRPRRSSGSRGLILVESKGQLLRDYPKVLTQYGSAIVQEYIPWGGMTYDVCVLMSPTSQPRAVFVGNRLRTYPVAAGPNVLGQGVEYPELRDLGLRMLAHLKWQGPAQVEFRIDPRDEAPVLMEVNPRFWGSMFLGIISGVDFPYLFYRMAVEGDIEPVLSYRTDMKARWLWPGDILNLLFNPHRLQVLPSWLGGFFDPRTKMYVPSLRDPLPVLGTLLATSVYGLSPRRLRYVLRLGGGANRGRP
ncbi:MAG: ATP-grasp domain-containing protein [Candidatus Bipolaricaulia bacterium]